MAESIFLSAFMQVVFQKAVELTPLLVRQFKRLWGADVINEEMRKLASTFTTIQAVLEDAEEQQHKNKAVRNWLAKLKEVVYDADDVLDEFHWEVLRQEAEGNNMKDQITSCAAWAPFGDWRSQAATTWLVRRRRRRRRHHLRLRLRMEE